MSVSEVQRLRDRVEELERILGIDQEMVNRIRVGISVTPDQAKMLGLLITRTIVTHDAMFTAVHGDKPECDQPTPKVMEVQLSQLRRRLKPYGVAVVNAWKSGWFLTATDKARVRQLLPARA